MEVPGAEATGEAEEIADEDAVVGDTAEEEEAGDNSPYQSTR